MVACKQAVNQVVRIERLKNFKPPKNKECFFCEDKTTSMP